MPYLIFDLNGTSMKPFLKSNEKVLVETEIPQKDIKIGDCLFFNYKVHRLISKHSISLKGDRLLYYDEHHQIDSNVSRVKGRIFFKEKKIMLSNYDHVILTTIRFLIAKFSSFNHFKNPLRHLFLVAVILLGQIHRKLELALFSTEFQGMEENQCS